MTFGAKEGVCLGKKFLKCPDTKGLSKADVSGRIKSTRPQKGGCMRFPILADARPVAVRSVRLTWSISRERELREAS